MLDYVNERLIFAVAQQPFEVPSKETALVNTFCSLVPLMDMEGKLVDLDDFYNCGLVWWMVRTVASSYAEPGRLVTGVCQEGKPSDPDGTYSMIYQADLKSVEPLQASTAVEVLSASAAGLETPNDLVSRRHLLSLDHPPSPVVLVRWRNSVYGPFRATYSRSSDALDAKYMVSLSPQAGTVVYEVPATDFVARYAEFVKRARGTVTRSKDNPRKPGVPVYTLDYEIATAQALEAIRSGGHRQLELRTEEDLVRSLANELLTRSQKREFKSQLDNLVQIAEARGSISPGVDAARHLIEGLERESSDLDNLGEALLQSGILDKRIQEYKHREASRYIEENAAQLAAEIAQQVERQAQKLEDLRNATERERSVQEALAKQAREALDVEAGIRQAQFNERALAKEADLLRQETEIEEQRAIVSRQLSELARVFTESRQELIGQFLAMTPLLEHVGIAPRSLSPPIELSEDETKEAPRTFAVPASPGRSTSSETEIDEATFFNRLEDVVTSQGFHYRRIDLVALHVAVKTSDLTILGGFSGTGKSSLVDLYARALAGSTATSPARFLQVWVSPSWLDSKDLLGHVNSLTSDFQPSETGLFEFLIDAHLEYERYGRGAGIYLVCLDEMNLAQVEHYFSGFLQALPSSSRTIRIFERAAVKRDSPYSSFASLNLAPTLRFVGTVNLDETTRQLSTRLLDRSNLIQLRSTDMGTLSRIDTSDRSPREVGDAIQLRDLKSWVRQGSLPPGPASLLDQMRGPLEKLGSPLNARRYQAISQFVRSAAGLCTELQAFDLQVAQRLLPQVRNIYGLSGRRDFDALRKVVDSAQLVESQAAIDTTLRLLAEEE